MLEDAQFNVCRQSQGLERLDRDKWIIAGRQDQRRQTDIWNERCGRGASVIVVDVAESTAGSGVQLIELTDGDAWREGDARQVREIALSLDGLRDESRGEVTVVETIAWLSHQGGT